MWKIQGWSCTGFGEKYLVKLVQKTMDKAAKVIGMSAEDF